MISFDAHLSASLATLPGTARRRERQGQIGHGLRQLDLVVAIIDAYQQVAGLDRLMFFHRHLGDEATDLGRHWHDVRLDLRVIGTHMRERKPPFPTQPARKTQHGKQQNERRRCGTTRV
jgi:hypothetical protein